MSRNLCRIGNEDTIRSLFSDLVLAVMDVHAGGVLLRNLTPAAVQLTSSGHVYLTDFSMAKLLALPTTTAKNNDKQQKRPRNRQSSQQQEQQEEQSRDTSRRVNNERDEEREDDDREISSVCSVSSSCTEVSDPGIPDPDMLDSDSDSDSGNDSDDSISSHHSRGSSTRRRARQQNEDENETNNNPNQNNIEDEDEDDDDGMPQLGRTFSFIGSPSYMAPEQLSTASRREQGYGAPADMWALGVTLYTTVVGRHPFLLYPPCSPLSSPRPPFSPTISVHHPTTTTGGVATKLPTPSSNVTNVTSLVSLTSTLCENNNCNTSSTGTTPANNNNDIYIPGYVSASLAQLLRGLLTTDEKRRWTLRDVQRCEWLKDIEWPAVRHAAETDMPVHSVVQVIDKFRVKRNQVLLQQPTLARTRSSMRSMRSRRQSQQNSLSSMNVVPQQQQLHRIQSSPMGGLSGGGGKRGRLQQGSHSSLHHVGTRDNSNNGSSSNNINGSVVNRSSVDGGGGGENGTVITNGSAPPPVTPVVHRTPSASSCSSSGEPPKPPTGNGTIAGTAPRTTAAASVDVGLVGVDVGSVSLQHRHSLPCRPTTTTPRSSGTTTGRMYSNTTLRSSRQLQQQAQLEHLQQQRNAKRDNNSSKDPWKRYRVVKTRPAAHHRRAASMTTDVHLLGFAFDLQA